MNKKVLSCLLVASLCLSMAATALAAPNSLSGNDDDEEDSNSSYVPSGSGTGSDSTTTAPATTQEVTAAVGNAVAGAVQTTGRGSAANVVMKNVSSISADTLKSAAKTAADAGGKVRLLMDNVVGNKIVSRMYIDPAKAANLTGEIKLGVATDNKDTRDQFNKYFTNEFAIASLEQKTPFGMEVSLAVKLDLSALNTNTLKFYAYDAATNTFQTMKTPGFYMDKNGYVHFDTQLGGDIIITDKALTLKK